MQEPVLIYDRIDANRRSTWLLLALFAAVLLPVAAYVTQYLMLWVALLTPGLAVLLSGDDWLAGVIVAAAIALAIVLAAAYLQYRRSSILLLRISRARPVEREDERELWQTAENLCIGAGLPLPKLHVIDDRAPNAFATGRDPDHASLVVTRGLLDLLDRLELEGVIGHELSHIGNQDTRLGAVLATGVGSLRLPLVVSVHIIRFLFQMHWMLGVGALLYVGLPLTLAVPLGIAFGIMLLETEPLAGFLLLVSALLPVYMFVGAPLLGHLISRAAWRQRELLADADAALLTRYPEGLARALAKIGAAGGALVRAGAATAHLFIVDPIPKDAPWWERILSADPPIERRVTLLAGMAEGIAPSVLAAAARAGAEFRRASYVPAAKVATPQSEGARDGAPSPTSEGIAVASGPTVEAFRLAAPNVAVYEEPSTASRRVGQLEAGALITVVREEGEFLQVITPHDRFGYVLASAPMNRVKPVSVEGPQEPE